MTCCMPVVVSLLYDRIFRSWNGIVYFVAHFRGIFILFHWRRPITRKCASNFICSLVKHISYTCALSASTAKIIFATRTRWKSENQRKSERTKKGAVLAHTPLPTAYWRLRAPPILSRSTFCRFSLFHFVEICTTVSLAAWAPNVIITQRNT